MATRHESLIDASEWRRAWRTTGPSTRRKIRRAYWRGEALEDPQLAALAIGYAQSARSPLWRRVGSRFPWGVALLLFAVGIAYVALSSTAEESGTIRFGIGLLSLAGAAAVPFVLPRLERRRQRFEGANWEVLRSLAGGASSESVARLLAAKRQADTVGRASAERE